MPNDNPSPEVVKYFKNKGIKGSYSWKDIFEKEHAYNFTVAKATEIEVLQTLKEDIQKAIDEGLSFRSYQKVAEERLQKLGWWGEKKQIDPKTGKEELVQLGSKRRLETIFNTNIRTANASGKWERIDRTKKLLPYLQYKLGSSRVHREEHKTYADTVLPVDDAFWSTHYPPNGWGCKCWVRQISNEEAQNLGISDSPPRPYKEVLNERTGKIEKQYDGVSLGFASNSGVERATTLSNFLNDKVENITTDMAHSVIQDTIQSQTFEEHYLSGEKENNLYLPIALISNKKVKTKLQLDNNTSVRFSGYTSQKAREKHADIKQKDYLLVQDIIDNGELIEDKGKFIGSLQVDSKYYKAVIKKVNKDKGTEIWLEDFNQINKSN